MHSLWSSPTITQEQGAAGWLGSPSVSLSVSRCFPVLHVFFSSLSCQAAELTPALPTDMEVKEAIQGAIHGENGEVVQIVTSVAT